MAKYHVTAKGEPGICRAMHQCPLGGESEHFDTPEAARSGFEAKMTADLLPGGVQKSQLGKRELNKLARITTDREILEAIVENGSDRTFKNLAENPETPADILSAARSKTSDPTVVEKLLVHNNYPVSDMPADDFLTAQKAALSTYGAVQPLRKPGLSDEHLDALVNDNKAKSIRTGSSGLTSNQLQSVVRNSKSNVSAERFIEAVEDDYRNVPAGLADDRYPAERFRNVPRGLVAWSAVYNTANSKVLNAHADWAIAHHDQSVKPGDKLDYSEKSLDHRNANDVALHIGRNSRAPQETLDRLAAAGLAPAEVYKNPNTSPKAKEMLARKSPRVAMIAKHEELAKNVGPLRSYFAVPGSSQTVEIAGRNRGINETRIQFDTAKLKEHGMDRNDVIEIMGRGHYNAGSSYDPATGIFKGVIDSSD
jgi:hypothetical protein